MYGGARDRALARPAPTRPWSRWGPGSAGTGSRLGFSGIEVGAALDATTALHGVPIAALRVSFADPRPRHQGVSHHSLTALSIATRSRVRVAVPCVGGVDEAQIRRDLARTGIDTRHEIVDVDPVGIARPVRGARARGRVDGTAGRRRSGAVRSRGRRGGRRGGGRAETSAATSGPPTPVGIRPGSDLRLPSLIRCPTRRRGSNAS